MLANVLPFHSVDKSLATFRERLLTAHKDPTVKFEKFEITGFDYRIMTIRPYVKLGWDCHLLIDNTGSPLPLDIDETKVYLYYKDDLLKTVDVKKFEIRARKTENLLISDETKFTVTDISFLLAFIDDWLDGKDCKFFLKAKLPVEALFFKIDKDVSCESVVKGKALFSKPTMTCEES